MKSDMVDFIKCLCNEVTVMTREPCIFVDELLYSGVLNHDDIFIPFVYRDVFGEIMTARTLRKRFSNSDEALQYSHKVVKIYNRRNKHDFRL